MKRLFTLFLILVAASSALAAGDGDAGEWPSLVPVEVAGEEIVFADFSFVNDGLEALGIGATLEKIEYVTAAGSGTRGRTILADDRGNKQMDYHWVPWDPRRGGYTDLTYAVDRAEAGTTSGLSASETEEAIDRAMETWQSVNCSRLEFPKNEIPHGLDVGIIEHILGFPSSPGVFADITHAGWQSGAFFDLVEPGGSHFIVGVTFTFVWVDWHGNPTDINGDGKADVAFREIYYNDEFRWTDDGASAHYLFDVETIALHEMGHGLSQDHFGAIFLDAGSGNGTGHVHFAPEAVMNAVSLGARRELRGSDIGGHCSIWATWPDS